MYYFWFAVQWPYDFFLRIQPTTILPQCTPINIFFSSFFFANSIKSNEKEGREYAAHTTITHIAPARRERRGEIKILTPLIVVVILFYYLANRASANLFFSAELKGGNYRRSDLAKILILSINLRCCCCFSRFITGRVADTQYIPHPHFPKKGTFQKLFISTPTRFPIFLPYSSSSSSSRSPFLHAWEEEGEGGRRRRD